MTHLPRRAAALLALSLIAPGLVAFGLAPTLSTALSARDEKEEELTPELWETLNGLFQRAAGQYQKRDYQKAADTYRELLKTIPAGAGYDRMRLQASYPAAASLALLGRGPEALACLEQAVANGLTEPRELDRNPDFDSIRSTPGFAALRERMRTKAEEARKKAEDERRRPLEALKAFDFTLTSVDGKRISRKEFLGQVLIVDVWGTWCGPCLMELPHFAELHRRYAEKGLRIVGLNSEKVADRAEAERRVKDCIRRYKVPYPCALAPEELLRTIPNFRAFPTTIFFARDGTARAMEVGARDLEALEAIVKPLLAEAAPAAAGTGEVPEVEKEKKP